MTIYNNMILIEASSLVLKFLGPDTDWTNLKKLLNNIWSPEAQELPIHSSTAEEKIHIRYQLLDVL